MTPKKAKRIKTIDLSSIRNKMERVKEEFEAKQREARERSREWTEYVEKTNAELFTLKGSYESLKLLLESSH